MTQVTPKYVNAPKQPTGKYGNLKLADNSLIFVPVDLLKHFRENVTYEVGLKHQTWGEGDEQRQVQIVTGPPTGAQSYVQSLNAPQQQSAAAHQPYLQQGAAAQAAGQAMPTGQVVQLTQPQPPALGHQAGGLGMQAGRSTHQDRMIFATGVVGRAMGSGKFTASEIRILLQAALQAFDEVIPS